MSKKSSKGKCAIKVDGEDNVFAYDGPALEWETPEDLQALAQICGADFPQTTCCSRESLDKILEHDSLVSSWRCPACSNGLRRLYCEQLCSPDQSMFMQVEHNSDNLATAIIVSLNPPTALVQACSGSFRDQSLANVTWERFVEERGSFRAKQDSLLKFTTQVQPGGGLLNLPSTSCLDSCSCHDCPEVCPPHPQIPYPNHSPYECTVGQISCYSFTSILLYAIFVVSILVYSAWKQYKKPSRQLWSRHSFSTSLATLFQDQDNYLVLDQSREASSRTRSFTEDEPLVHRSRNDSVNSNGYNTISLEQIEVFLQPQINDVNQVIASVFFRLGYLCAKYPYLFIAVNLLICGVLNIGWKDLDVNTRFHETWNQPDTPKWDSLVPYKFAQLIVSIDSGNSSMLDPERIKWIAQIEQEVELLQSSGDTLADFCISSSSIAGERCIATSITNYLRSTEESRWQEEVQYCTKNWKLCEASHPAFVFSNPLFPEQSQAMFVTWKLKQSRDLEYQSRLLMFGKSLRTYFAAIADPTSQATRDLGIRVDYVVPSSFDEEITKNTSPEIGTLLWSYLLIFIYVLLTLGASGAGCLKVVGKYALSWVQTIFQVICVSLFKSSESNHPRSLSPSLADSTISIGAYLKRQIFVDSKFVLGTWSIALSLLVITTTISLASWLDIPLNFITAKTLPFLCLANSIDYCYLLCSELDKQNSRAYAVASRIGNPIFVNDDRDGINGSPNDPLASPEQRVARCVGRVAPSILFSLCGELLLLICAICVGASPAATRNFAIYALIMSLITFLLYSTMFPAFLLFDLRRIESNRIDCFPCLKLTSSASTTLGPAFGEGIVSRTFRVIYGPILLNRFVKYVTLFLFGALFVLSCICSSTMKLEMDESISFSASSYLTDYLHSVAAFSTVGPSVFFSTTELDFSAVETQKKLCSGLPNCDLDSTSNILLTEVIHSNQSFIHSVSESWIDDFHVWANTQCKDPTRQSERCLLHDPALSIVNEKSFPSRSEFYPLLHNWMEQQGNKYASYLEISRNKTMKAAIQETTLIKSLDYGEAFISIKRIAKEMQSSVQSVQFHAEPFAVQSLLLSASGHMEAALLVALLLILMLTRIVLKSWRSGFVLLTTFYLSVNALMGLIALWGVSLNPLTVINLVVTSCFMGRTYFHLAKSFTTAHAGGLPYRHPSSQKDRDERIQTALVEMGSPLWTGVLWTKLIALLPLLFSSLKLLNIYCFRIWTGGILITGVYAFGFLPVSLSLWGGQGWTADDQDEDWLGHIVGSNYETDYRTYYDTSDEEW